MLNQKVRASDLDLEKLTFTDLIWHYGTGQSYIILDTGKKKQRGYRFGVMTRVGDLEVSEWQQLVMQLIQRAGEMPLYDRLLSWVTDNVPWLHTKKERELEALQLHTIRIFEDPDWPGYKAFHADDDAVRV